MSLKSIKPLIPLLYCYSTQDTFGAWDSEGNRHRRNTIWVLKTVFIWQLQSSNTSSRPTQVDPRRGSVRLRTRRGGEGVRNRARGSLQQQPAAAPRGERRGRSPEAATSVVSAWMEGSDHGAQEELENLRRATATPGRRKGRAEKNNHTCKRGKPILLLSKLNSSLCLIQPTRSAARHAASLAF